MEKKLYRSVKNRKIAGICAGLAEYFGIDVTVMRLLFAIALFFCAGLIIYLIAWIVVPEEPVRFSPDIKEKETFDPKQERR